MSDLFGDGDRRNENDQIYEQAPLAPDAGIDEIREYLRNAHQWIRTREPVGEGSKYLKFMTYGAAERIGLIQILEDDIDVIPDPGITNPEEMVVDVYARDMVPTLTDGCSALATVALGGLKPNIHTLGFSNTIQQSADFEVLMPDGWVGGQFNFRIYWSHTTGATSFNVKWQLGAHSVADDETIGVELVGGNVVSDVGGTANNLYITSATASIPITNAFSEPGDLVFFRISRLINGVTGNLNIPARLHAIKFELTKQPGEPQDPPVYADVLICNFSGTPGATTFLDEGPYNFTLTGNAAHQLSNAQSMLGTTSMSVTLSQGTGSAGVLTAASANAGLTANEPFTMECYVYIVLSSAVSFPLLEWFHGSTARDRYQLQGGATATAAYENEQFGSEETFPPSIPMNQWVHTALSYDGATVRRWVNGALVASFASRSFSNASNGQLLIGGLFSDSGSTAAMQIYVGPTRFSRGCRYVSAFTPPAVPFVPGT